MPSHSSISRKRLQALAKAAGIPANAKSAVISAALDARMTAEAGAAASHPRSAAAGPSADGDWARLRLTAAYCVVYLAVETLPALVGPAMPVLPEALGVTESGVIVMPSFIALGAVVGGLLAGFVFDLEVVRGGFGVANTVLATSSFAVAGLHAAVPFSSSGGVLASLSLGIGFLNGLIRAGENTMVLRLHGLGAGPHLVALHFFGGMARVVAPVVLSMALRGTTGEDGRSVSEAIRQAYVIVSLMPVGAGLALAFLGRSGSMAAAEKAASPDVAAAERSEDGGGREIGGRGSSGGGALVQVALLAFLTMAVQLLCQTYLPVYSSLPDTLAFTPTDSANLASAFGLSFTLGRLVAIPLSAATSPLLLIWGNSAGLGAAAVALMAWPASPFVVYAAACGFGLSLASMFPSILNYAREAMPGAGAREVTIVMQAGAAGGIAAPAALAWSGGEERLVPLLIVTVVAADAVLFLLTAAALGANTNEANANANAKAKAKAE